MDRIIKTSDAPEDLVWIPCRAVIADLTPCFRYIQDRRVLDVFSKQLGLKRFMDEVMLSYFQQDIDDFEDALGNFFDLDEVEKMEIYGIYRYDLHAELCEFQTFRDKIILGSLSPDIQEEFIEYGSYIKKWISPTQVIIESNSRQQVPRTGTAARRYRQTSKDLGLDR